MSRSAQVSGDETDIKSGRKTDFSDTASADLPLRRSSRIKLVMQNESPFGSPLKDNTSIAQTKVTRRQIEVGEATTPTTRRRRSSIINDAAYKTDTQRRKQFTRAGSESKSSPVRTTRHTRSMSMDPEITTENKQRNEHKLTRTPIKSRKVHTLSNVNETTELDLNNLSILEEKGDSVSNVKDNLKTDCYNISEESTENNISENLPSKIEDVEKDSSTDNENVPNNKNESKESESLCITVESQRESLVHNLSQSFSEKSDHNTSKKLGLKIENLLSNSMEKHDDFSNKENLTTNVISDESHVKNSGSSTLFQSLKPLSVSNQNKLIEEESKFSCNLSSRSRHSRSSESMDDATVSVKENNSDNVSNNSVIGNMNVSVNTEDTNTSENIVSVKEDNGDNVGNNSVVENMNVSVNTEDTDTSDNMPKLAIETDSSIESVYDINSHGNTECVKYAGDIKTTDEKDKIIDTDATLNMETGEALNDECNKISKDVVVSNVEKVMNDKDDTIKAVTESCASENVQNDDTINCHSSVTLIDAVPLTSPDNTLTTDTEFSTISKNKSTLECKNINKENITNNLLNFSDTCMSPTSSVSINTDKDSVTDLIKTGLSSTITKEQIKLTEEILEKEPSVTNSLTSNNELMEKLESSKQKSESIQEICNKSQDGMDYDDSDTNKSAVNSLNNSLTPDNEPMEKLDSGEQKSESIQEMCNKSQDGMDYDDSDTNKRAVNSLNNSLTPDNEPMEKLDSSKQKSESIQETCNKSQDVMDYDDSDTNKSAVNSLNNSLTLDNESMEKLDSSKQKSESIQEACNKTQDDMDYDNSDTNKSAVNSLNNSLASNNEPIEKLESGKQKSESIQEICNKSQDGINSDDNDSNKNAVNSCQDVLTDELKETNTNVDKNSIHSVSTEKLDNEMEAECDLVLVEKEACVPAKNMEAEENKASDYDSNNTSLLKMQRDSINEQINEHMEESLGYNSTIEINKNLTVNKNNVDNENMLEDTEDCKDDTSNKDFKNISQNKSITEKQSEHCLLEHNVSTRQSVEDKNSYEFHKETEIDEISLLNNSNFSEDVSEKQKSLNKSVCETDKLEIEENQQKEIRKEDETTQMQETNTIEKKINGNIITETHNENEQQNNEEIIDELINTSDKRNRIMDDGKKTKLIKISTFQLEKSKEEHNFLVSNKFIVEDAEQSLNDSQLMSHEKAQKGHSNSMKCSTPKSHTNDNINEVINTSNVQIVDELNTSLKGKLLKVANNILDIDRRKKQRKRKRIEKTNEGDTLIAVNFDEDADSQIKNKNQYTVSIGNTDKNEQFKETSLNEENKMKKKKQKITHSDINKHIEEDALYKKLIESEVTKKSIPKKLKKKQKEEIENVQDIYSENQISEKKSKKISRALPNEEIINNEKSNKKQKLSSTDITSPNNEIVKKLVKEKKKLVSEDVSSEHKEDPVKKLSKKKKKLVSEDISSQHEKVSVKKLFKEKKTLISDDVSSQHEEVPDKKLSKKKKTLVSENISSQHEEVPVEKLSKKKKTLVSENISSQHEEVPVEKLSKKKKTLVSEDVSSKPKEVPVKKLSKEKKKMLEDVSLQHKEVPVNKLSKEKKKLISNDISSQQIVPIKKPFEKKQDLLTDDFSQSENISAKKSSKKKVKLLLENDRKNKVESDKVSNKPQQSKHITSDLDERQATIKFSKPRKEALKVTKHTTDVEANKEIEKKEQKKYVEGMQKEETLMNKNVKQKVNINKPEIKKNVKRSSDEGLDNSLRDIFKLRKRRKLSKLEEQILPSETKKVACLEKDYVLPSSCGSTTNFTIENIKTIKKKKTQPAIYFKRKRFTKNSR